jgi:cytochrome b561
MLLEMILHWTAILLVAVVFIFCAAVGMVAEERKSEAQGARRVEGMDCE